MRQKTAARTMIAMYVVDYFLIQADEPWHRALKEHSLREKCREKVLFDKSLLELCCPPYASPAPKEGGGV
jgi:hypothetical protein